MLSRKQIKRFIKNNQIKPKPAEDTEGLMKQRESARILKNERRRESMMGWNNDK